MALRILEFFIFLLTVWAVIFQMILPALASKPMFPAFRKKRLDIEQKIIAEREEADLKQLQSELNPPATKDAI